MITVIGMMSMAYSSASSRTWYIKVDGSGDAPTIQAGVDSAMAGDTVLVGPGTYAIPSQIEMKSNIVLRSEGGPANTIIKPSQWGYFSGIRFRRVTNCEVNGFWIKPFYGGDGCIKLDSSSTITISNNIIESSDSGMWMYYCAILFIRHNLFIGEDGGSEGYGITFNTPREYIELKNNVIVNDIYCPVGFPYFVGCNDILGDPGCIGHGYFELDPQFCGVSGALNYYLQSDSPCAPGNDPLGGYCGLIGPLPVGCGTVDVEKKTWGEIKTLYQN